MTDTTAGAPTDPAPETESVTDAPAPDTTPDPSTTTEPTTVGDALDAAVATTPGRIVPAIDGTVEQGNRVTAVSEITRTDPLADIKARIVDHAENSAHIVADLRALADELEQALNKVRVGL